jgi:glycosyltransferase involved in cell wall biosynthesis
MNEFFIIIPCFNPTKKIESIINKLHRKFEGNIILVDDGNTTKNKKYLQSIANKNIRIKLLNHAVNLGKGAAIKTALNYILTKRNAYSIFYFFLRAFIFAHKV